LLGILNVGAGDTKLSFDPTKPAERTEWHRVVVFNPYLVSVVEKYVTKGTRLYVEGQVQTRKWSGQDGVERISTEVVLQRFGGVLLILDKGASQGDRPSSQSRQQSRSQQDLDDEIPF